jgi:hypothetical protein
MDAISDLLSEESKLNIKKNNGLEQRKYLRN